MVTLIRPTLVLPKRALSRRRYLLILLVVMLLIVLVTGFVGLIFSNMLLTPDHQDTFPLEVIKVSTNSVTLPRTHDTEQRGIFGLNWAGGQAAIIGDITAKNQDTVTRPLLQRTAPLIEHTKVSINENVFLGTLCDTLGLAIQDIQIASPLGQLPALYLPGKSDTWAILIHGLNQPLESGLRFFPPLTELGLPILEASYRNDVGAPASPDGLIHLGYSEWQDVEASAHYAIEHGAQHLVIYGWSMGGTIAEEFMQHSAYASRVQAMVFDALVLDWRTTLNLQAANRHLPDIFANVAEFISAQRTGINFDALDLLNQDQNQTPILLFHGTGDTSTPISASDIFAKAHPDTVTYERVQGAEHVQSWNTNPQKYGNQVSTFLTRVLQLPAATT